MDIVTNPSLITYGNMIHDDDDEMNNRPGENTVGSMASANRLNWIVGSMQQENTDFVLDVLNVAATRLKGDDAYLCFVLEYDAFYMIIPNFAGASLQLGHPIDDNERFNNFFLSVMRNHKDNIALPVQRERLIKKRNIETDRRISSRVDEYFDAIDAKYDAVDAELSDSEIDALNNVLKTYRSLMQTDDD